ncbi:MAG TPA: aminotransferase class I/II-fold pyridoxal phosphate-dependent enzyme [Candidatus Paceibacterota bacterium]|nr:aminotransferase class I/II-fold pyridoxal phosphate-dependent enzyme [Candidatus Paceibacterota bacterium]HMO82761.1 aminotransferase class I/II-fold pyridoxal phosphate-dependent enzyme [Candidatus Paceibacterota bacterium]
MSKTKQTKLRVPYGFSVHGQEEIDAVVEVLKGNTAIGDKTSEFEAKIAKLFGKKYGVMVNSGSSANLLAFELLNLPKGSEVITPALTFATVVAPIIQKGLIPVFVDVDPTTYLPNFEQVKKAITKKTKALMIPSLMGNIPNMRAYSDLAKKHKLFFIEDSCDTLGGKFEGKPTGVYSDISITSFYGSHIINGAGGGGMIMVNDSKWEHRLKVLRGWGRQSSLYGEKANSELLKNRFNYKLGGVPYDNKFTFSEIGYNFLPLEVSSAFALAQMKRLPGFLAKRQKNFENLTKFISTKDKYFILPTQTPDTETAWLAFPVIIKPKSPFTRLEIVTFLEGNNIQTRPVFTGNILKQPGFKKIESRKISNILPNTDFIMKNAFVLACHHGLDEDQILYLESKINEFLAKYN